MRSPAALEAIIAHFGALTEALKKALNKKSEKKTAAPV
jgi:hypothetical protein